MKADTIKESGEVVELVYHVTLGHVFEKMYDNILFLVLEEVTRTANAMGLKGETVRDIKAQKCYTPGSLGGYTIIISIFKCGQAEK